MNIDSNGLFTWTPSQTQSPGTNTITIVAANTNAFDTVNPVLTATNTFTVTVKEINQPPSLPAIGVQAVTELMPLTVTNTATEPNIHAVTTSYTLVSPLVGMNIDSNGVFTWTPSQAQSHSTNTVTVAAANTNAFDAVNPVLMVTNSFTVIVIESNIAPVLPVVGPQTVGEKLLLTVTNTASEPNVDSLTTGYTIVGPLTGMNVDTNGIFTWTPAQTQSPSTNTITIVAANTNAFDPVNPVLAATNTFTVVVKEINQPPTLSLIGIQTVAELAPLTVTNTATESNIHSVTSGYTLVNPLSGMNIDSNGVFTWTPSQAQSHSTNTVTVVVANSNTFDTVNPVLMATNSFTVIVTESNIAPVLPMFGTQTVIGGGHLVVNNAATEPNTNAVTVGYRLINPPSGMSISGAGVITWTPLTPGTNTVTTVVTNNDSFDLVNPTLTATNSFTIVVTPASTNTTPVIQSITSSNGVITITWGSVPGQLYQVQYKGSFGATNWQPLGPGILATNTVTSATDTNANPQRFYRIAMLGMTTNTPPVLPNQGSFSVHALSTLTVTNTATDDGPASGLTYVLTNSPAGAAIDTNGVITWTPTVAQSPGTNTITTIVTDSGTPPMSATNSFTVIVAGPVTLQSVTISGTNTVVTWSSLASHNYRLQYKNSFSDSNWTDVVPDVQAAGVTVSVTNAAGSSPQRFYRVRLLP